MKNIIEWKDEYLLGDSKIDAQHKKLFEMANNALVCHQDQSISSNERGKRVNKILLDLQEYIQTHLEYEEKYMEEIEYPQYEEHVQMHTKMRNIMALVVEKASNLSDFEISLTNLLETLFITHIKEYDTHIIDWKK
jgi:hemerythrin